MRGILLVALTGLVMVTLGAGRKREGLSCLAADTSTHTTVCDLIARPSEYIGKSVTVTAILASGLEGAIFIDNTCLPAHRDSVILPNFHDDYSFGTELDKKLNKLLRKRQQAQVTIVGDFVDPGRYVGHLNCCRYKLVVRRLLRVEEVPTKSSEHQGK